MGNYSDISKRRKTEFNYRRRNPDYFLWWAAKKRAIRDGIEFSISRDDVHIPEVCPVLGIRLEQRSDGKRGPCEASPTIDRRDNNKGYTPDNICVISHKANRLKSNMIIDDLVRLIAYMSS